MVLGGACLEGGIGISGQYSSSEEPPPYLTAGKWHRVAFAIDHVPGAEKPLNLAFVDRPPVGPAPTLSVARAPGGITISWPAGSTGFTLESTSSLTSPSWTAVGGVANNSVTIQPTEAARFYRLKQ